MGENYYTVMLQWQPVMSTAFLGFALIVLYLAVNGKFSRKFAIKLPLAGNCKPSTEDCSELKKELVKALAAVNEKQRRIEELEAMNAELERKVQDLMNTINRLTLELDASRADATRYKASLKQALDELVACRRALTECKAKLLAKQVNDEVCKMAPENANLIR